jgi:hypothetical protein
MIEALKKFFIKVMQILKIISDDYDKVNDANKPLTENLPDAQMWNDTDEIAESIAGSVFWMDSKAGDA